MRSYLLFFFLGLCIVDSNIATAANPPAFIPESTSKKCFPINATSGVDDLNFGVVLYTPDFKFTRSSGLGDRGLNLIKAHFAEKHLQLPNKILYLNSTGYTLDISMSWNAPKKYASEGAKRIYSYLKEKWIRPVYNSGPYAYEEELMSQSATGVFPFKFTHGANSNVYLNGDHPLHDMLSPQMFKTSAGVTIERRGGRDALYQVLEELLTHDGLIDFHCEGGIHRTGMTALMIRYLQGGYWTNEETLDGFENLYTFSRYGVFPNQVISIKNLAEFEYFQHNPYDFKQANLEAIKTLSKDERFQCLKDQFSCYLNAPSELPVSCYQENPVDSSRCQKPLNKKKAWETCSRLAIETELATEMDEIASRFAKNPDSDQEKESTFEAITSIRQRIEKLNLPTPENDGDAPLMSRMKGELDKRAKSILEIHSESNAVGEAK